MKITTEQKRIMERLNVPFTLAESHNGRFRDDWATMEFSYRQRLPQTTNGFYDIERNLINVNRQVYQDWKVQSKCNCGILSTCPVGFNSYCCYDALVPVEYTPGSLIQAIKAFRVHNRYKEYWSARGACYAVSCMFAAMCHQMKIKMKIGEFGDCINFWHVINVYEGLIIDWTSAQYGEEFPGFPYVCRLNEHKFGIPRV